MLHLRDQVFGQIGFTSDLFLPTQELEIVRNIVSNQWKAVIKEHCPIFLVNENGLNIENYHSITHMLDHNKIWSKTNRLLSEDSINQIKSMSFFRVLKNEFGPFEISDVYDTRQHFGREEIYWRLVRPGVVSDIGPFHADKWFHETFNSGRGMFSDEVVTVKVWVPLFCEPGKSGLAILPGSHRHDWSYHVEEVAGFKKPIPNDDFNDLGAKLIATEPGNALIFHEKTIHGGAVNDGSITRVSIEITMVLKKDNMHFI